MHKDQGAVATTGSQPDASHVGRSETRTFTVNPAIIQHLISSQAGTLEKAFAECVMNSIDAGASKIEVTIDSDRFTVADDGCGFRTRAEVLACFEEFGFEHTDKDRVFGQFGLGRAQLWNWASTVWRTHTFALDVDIRARGLDYRLETEANDQPGMAILGRFYEPLDEAARQACLRGIAKLCKYAVIPVIVNGKDVRKNPAHAKWTYEDENCWIEKSDTWELNVYNQGILVRGYSSSEMGVGGVAVTKRGKVLAVNMSRTDVLTQTCVLWPRLKAACRGLIEKEIEAKITRLTDDRRDFLARQTIDPSNCDHFEHLPVFTLTNGHSVTLLKLLGDMDRKHIRVLTVADRGDRLAERAMQSERAVVLARRTLARFDVDTLRDLVATLLARMRAAATYQQTRWLLGTVADLERIVADGYLYESLDASPCAAEMQAETLPRSDWTRQELYAIRALDAIDEHLRDLIAEYTGVACEPRQRTVGISNAAEAFTDGSSYIAYEKRVLSEVLAAGLPGFARAVALTVHEYLHNEADSGSHSHDAEFYSVFHDIILDPNGVPHKLALTAFRHYCVAARRISPKLARQVDAANGNPPRRATYTPPRVMRYGE